MMSNNKVMSVSFVGSTFSMVKRSKHAGLLLITDDNKAVILQAHKSYNENVNRNLRYNKHIPFVEKLSIPRGKHDSGEKDYETAAREFIEETGLVFDRVSVYAIPFVLEWQDNAKMYKYTIYVAFLDGALHGLRRRPNSYNIRLSKCNGEYRVDMTKLRYKTHELIRRIEFMNFNKYVNYMKNRQLSTYRYSNYDRFFDYVQYVVNLHSSKKEAERFFVMEFHWYADQLMVPESTL
ncbi:BV-E31 [Plodia interpunctella granulovirus]|uniref:BV-E31 n=1 Tax=Plodia interpunctella granulovirus TaxID=262175 RepID=A0A1L5JHG5_9BBAC|nr:BV-E31 [Plodia interpunctella granulovirus]APO13940.1 BV-E31 [Plodia interpunctella granulovirus]